MEQSNRYDRYQDDDNRSSNYRRQQYNRGNRDFENSWDDDQARYSGQRSSEYNSQRGDYRGGQYTGNDWRENNWKTGESNAYRSGRDYDSYRNYGTGGYGMGMGMGYGNDFGRGNQSYNRNYEERNQGWNSRNWGDRNEGRNYNREDYDRNERGWWDKTTDEVSSWFGDDEAKRRRQMDRINEQTHRGKGPKNYKRSQEKIKEDINERLSDDDYLDASDIEVDVIGTEVTLSGTVNSRQDKRRAEDLAERVSGVTNVQNNLRVKSTSDINTTGSSPSATGSESLKGTKSTSSTSLTNSGSGKEQHLHN
jgi:osmotically-inducible protein OsmY